MKNTANSSPCQTTLRHFISGSAIIEEDDTVEAVNQPIDDPFASPPETAGNGEHVVGALVLASELGVQLQKSETRTDWLRRPLSPAQLHYAAEDVAFLPALWRVLSDRLAGGANGAWALAECVATLERFRNRDGADYRAVAGAWRLDQRALALLRPRSVAILGASDRSRWSQAVVENLEAGSYAGALHLVNPRGGIEADLTVIREGAAAKVTCPPRAAVVT